MVIMPSKLLPMETMQHGCGDVVGSVGDVVIVDVIVAVFVVIVVSEVADAVVVELCWC